MRVVCEKKFFLKERKTKRYTICMSNFQKIGVIVKENGKEIVAISSKSEELPKELPWRDATPKEVEIVDDCELFTQSYQNGEENGVKYNGGYIDGYELEEVTPQAYLLKYCNRSYETVRYGYVGSYTSASLDLGDGRFLNCNGTSSSQTSRDGNYTLSITESPLFEVIYSDLMVRITYIKKKSLSFKNESGLSSYYDVIRYYKNVYPDAIDIDYC